MFMFITYEFFAKFEFFDSELRYIVVGDGQSAERNFVGPKMGHLGLILAQE